MGNRNDRYETRELLLAAATRWVSNDHYLNASFPPGPHDDATMELADEELLVAARKYVEAHVGVKTINP